MTPRAPSDQEIGAALLAPGDAAGQSASCRRYHEELFWHMVRGGLDEALKGEILDHSAECSDCTLALRVARETSAAAAEARPSSPRSGFDLRGLLARTLLHPIPAAAYLLLLALSFPLYRAWTAGSRATGESNGLRGLQVLQLTGDLALRGGDAPEPVRVRLQEFEALVLKLYPDIEDLPEDANATLAVRVLDGTNVVAEARRRVADLDRDESLGVLLDPALLQAGRTYRVELTAGESLLLRQSLRIDPR